MTEEELREYIGKYPESEISQAFSIGRRTGYDFGEKIAANEIWDWFMLNLIPSGSRAKPSKWEGILTSEKSDEFKLKFLSPTKEVTHGKQSV